MAHDAAHVLLRAPTCPPSTCTTITAVVGLSFLRRGLKPIKRVEHRLETRTQSADSILAEVAQLPFGESGRRLGSRGADLFLRVAQKGRYSTKILPNPDVVLEVKEAVARAIEGLR